MSIRDEEAYEAASMYYLQGQTMETIAKQMGMSRSSVSRLLAFARSSGLVRISVAPVPGSRGTLTGELNAIFGIHASVVPVRDVETERSHLHNVAQVAAQRLVDLMEPGATLGIAWGNTTAEIVLRLPHVSFPGSTVVQLNGAANASATGVPYADSIITQAARAFDATMVHFPVPAFFDRADAKRALWAERSIGNVLDTISTTTVALFGVGALDATPPSHVYAGGFLDAEEIAAAKADGVVGDVCTVLIRRDGSTDMTLNERATGPTPEQLATFPRRLCVVSGTAKAVPLLAALRAGVVTDLVLDDACARAVLDLVRAEGVGGRTMGR